MARVPSVRNRGYTVRARVSWCDQLAQLSTLAIKEIIDHNSLTQHGSICSVHKLRKCETANTKERNMPIVITHLPVCTVQSTTSDKEY